MINNPVKISTPYFQYDLDKVIDNAKAYKRLAKNGVRILYATMANARKEILEAVKEAKIGVFVNSISHLRTSLKVGIKPKDIVFAGSGHTELLMKSISSLGLNYHADSFRQLESYLSFSPKGKIGLRVNVGSLLDNPQLDPAPRLGMSVDEIYEAIAIYKDQVSTLHVYVGTNLLNSDLHCNCLRALTDIAKNYPVITDIDIGGGFAFAPGDRRDHGMWQEVLRVWEDQIEKSNHLQLTIEPGRSIVRTAGKFYVKVTDVRYRHNNIFVTVDSSGTWFPRKIVHDADEEIVSVVDKELSSNVFKKTHICGNTTFSKDFLSVSDLPEMEIGDTICFSAAGAYNEAMHMDFLGIPAPAVVIKKNGMAKLIREHESHILSEVHTVRNGPIAS